MTPFGVGNVLDNALTGNAVANSLLGGAGNDTLNGMGGNDVLWGQAGADTFILQRGTGIDVIADFEPGIDRIGLSGTALHDFEALLEATVQYGPSCAVDLGGGDRMILRNVPKAALHETDFLFN